MNKARLRRLQDAIGTEGGDTDQVKSVLRMLGEEVKEDQQLTLFRRRKRG
ncbi:MAG: hypothetical protein H0W90_16820 [Actinobacteria bacterium]|nr:hypothetical protein [Actinomycetota bacterium]